MMIMSSKARMALQTTSMSRRLAGCLREGGCACGVRPGGGRVSREGVGGSDTRRWDREAALKELHKPRRSHKDTRTAQATTTVTQRPRTETETHTHIAHIKYRAHIARLTAKRRATARQQASDTLCDAR